MNKGLRIFGLILATVTILLGVFYMGIRWDYTHRPAVEKVTTMFNKGNEIIPQTDFEPFWKAWNILNEKSIFVKKITDQDKVWGSISGLASSINDPYTVFFPPEEAKSFSESVSGEFSGLGMEVGMKDKILTVIAPLKDTPAYKGGMKSGDKILKIDSISTNDLSIDKAIRLMRGEKGTKVVLTIFREGEKSTREISLIRDIIAIPTIDTKKRDDGIFVISLYNFSATSTQLFREALQEFANSGSTKLVLDLRGNPGGYLESAIDMASWFLPKDKTVVVEDDGSKNPTIYKSTGYNVFAKSNLKMVILIDSGSASASEILAGALSEHGVAKLVGIQSFGKGSVQELVQVTPETYLKVTVAKWLTPKGVSISEQGLKPDYEVKLPKDYDKTKKDTQMDKAVEILNK